MKTARRAAWTLALILAGALPALADAGPDPLALPGELTLEPAQAKGGKDRFTLGVRVEYWEAEDLEITSSSNAFGLSETVVEQGVEWRLFHSAALLQGDYQHDLSMAFIRGHVGLGMERIGTTFETDATNVINPNDETDNVYDTDIVWEIGGSFGFSLAKTADGVISVVYRGGESTVDRPGGEEIDYSYTMIRVTGEAGLTPQEGVRLFAALRYTLYEAEWEFSDPNPEFSFDLEFDQPVGISLGAELFSTSAAGGAAARIELQFVDVLGFVASAGWRF